MCSIWRGWQGRISGPGIHLLTASVLVLSAACSDSSTAPPPDGGPPDGDPGTASITVRIASPSGHQSGGAARVDLFVLASGAGELQRAGAYGVSHRGGGSVSYSEEAGASNEFTWTLPRGTRVALIAQENVPGGFFVPSGGVSPFPASRPVEFLRFTGDFVQADIGNDPGTLNFVLTSDRQIEAEFVEMGTFLLQVEGRGFLTVEDCSTAPLVITDNFEHWCDVLIGGNLQAVGSTEPQLVRATWFRSNSTLVVRAADWPEAGVGCGPPPTDECFVFDSWLGGSVSGRESTFNFTARHHFDARLKFRDSSG